MIKSFKSHESLIFISFPLLIVSLICLSVVICSFINYPVDPNVIITIIAIMVFIVGWTGSNLAFHCLMKAFNLKLEVRERVREMEMEREMPPPITVQVA